MKTNFFHKMKYDLKGHPMSYKTTFMPKCSNSFVYVPILIKISMNANILKTQIFQRSNMTCHFYVIEKFCDFLL